MEFVMRAKMRRNCMHQGDHLLSLDWESLGRLVRQQTLYAVAAHFASLGQATGKPVAHNDMDHSPNRFDL